MPGIHKTDGHTQHNEAVLVVEAVCVQRQRARARGERWQHRVRLVFVHPAVCFFVRHLK